MAIKKLDARYPEIGRIRLGDKEITHRNGKEHVRPRKGEFLRFTSNDDVALKAIASQHGGEVVAWEKGEQAWQLTSETQWIEALLPPDPLGDTPIYERWGSGGIQRRCDGERCLQPLKTDDGGHMEEVDCVCLAEGLTPGDAKDTHACNVTLRIRLVLPYVPGLGVWVCTSHSWIGALELPGQFKVIEAMRERGRMIPVLFGIEQRTLKKPWESYRRDFIVPSIRSRESLAQLQAASGMLPELADFSPSAVDGPAVLANPAAAPLAIEATSAPAPVAAPAARRSAKADSAPAVQAAEDGTPLALATRWARIGREPQDLPSFVRFVAGCNPGDLTAEQVAQVRERMADVSRGTVDLVPGDGDELVWAEVGAQSASDDDPERPF